MKKILILFAFLFTTLEANCDVIFFPYQYSGISYSAEVIYSVERLNSAKNTTNIWIGIGCVGSFLFLDQPAAGFEFAFEKRHYFQPEKFKHFSISGYIGAAFMTNLDDINDVGLVPGFKINYKAQISPKIILEPYISLSVPICYNIVDESGYVPFPVLTVGVRFGLCEHMDKRKN